MMTPWTRNTGLEVAVETVDVKLDGLAVSVGLGPETD